MKKFSELTLDELHVVFERNSRLRHIVYDACCEDVNTNNEDVILSYWDERAIDYMLGYTKGAFFKVCNSALFISGLQKAQNDFRFLHRDYDKVIDEADRLLKQLEQELDGEQAYKSATRLDQIVCELERACLKRFLEEFEFYDSYANQLAYFLEVYADSRINDNFYVDDDYILYEDVRYTKCYK